MAEPDWYSHMASEGTVSITMVSQNNLGMTKGPLNDVLLENTKVTGAYYTDSRTSGSVSYVGNGWIRDSFIRFAYDIPEYSYHRVLGTYVATDDSGTLKNGAWTTKLSLQSAGLYTLSTEICEKPWTLAKNCSARTAMHQILDKSNRPYKDIAKHDYRVTSPVVLESGKSVLDRLYSIASLANIRIDTDGDGYVTISDYIRPANKTPVMRIDLADPYGVVLDGVQRNTDYLKVPGRATVIYKYTESKTVNGKSQSIQHEISASADATGYASPQSRGYVITDYHSLTELTPQNYAQALRLAQQYIKENAHESAEWEISTTYLPLWEGDVVELYVRDGDPRYVGVRKCLVKSIDIDLSTMQMDMTLKEVSTEWDDSE